MIAAMETVMAPQCCENAKETCHISTLNKKEEEEMCKWIPSSFDEKEFPFSRELSDKYANPSASPAQIKAFAATIFEEAWKKKGMQKPKCSQHEGHILEKAPLQPLACCAKWASDVIGYPWDIESGRWWRGREVVNESAIPAADKDATKIRVNRFTDRYWPPFGDSTTRVPIRMISLLADEGDTVRDCNAALLRKVAAAAQRRVGWPMIELTEMKNDSAYVLQWRDFRSKHKADVFIFRMHQVFGYDTDPAHARLMLAFEELRRHHGDELRFPDLIAPAAGLLMVGRLVSLKFLEQVSSLVCSVLNAHPAKPVCMVVPHGIVPSCSSPMPAYIPEYPLLVRLRNQASKRKYVVFDHAGLHQALKDLQRDPQEKMTTRRDLIFEKFYADRVVKRVFVIGNLVLVREKPALLRTSVPGHFCRWTLQQFAKRVNGQYVELPKDANSVGMVTYLSDPADMKNPSRCPPSLLAATRCEDDILRLCASVISKQMNHLKIFRFDAIPSSSGKSYTLVKFVILPIMIYDGIPDAPERLLNLIVSRSTRRLFRKETWRLRPLDVMEMALNNVPGWKSAGLCLGDLKTRKINPWKSRYVVSIDVKAGKFIRNACDMVLSHSWVHPRAVLLRFYRIVSPIHRWLEDESAFANLVDHVHFTFGLGPAYGDPIKAAYFGTERTIAKTRDWIHGWSLHHLLLDDAALPHKFQRVFTSVGDSLARFHLMFDDPLFHGLHVQESDGSIPQVVTWQLLEVWRRDALLAASCSTTTKRLERMQAKEKMEEWDWLFNTLWNACGDIEFLKNCCIRSVKTREARRVVWGYHDLHCDNVIIEEEDRVDLGDYEDGEDDDDESSEEAKERDMERRRRRMKKLYDQGPKSVQFGQADYSGPAFAVFDLASILVSFEDIRLRQERTGAVGFTSDVRSDAIRWIVEGYLKRLQAEDAENAENHLSIEELAPRLIHDAWVFAPLAALMKAFDFFYEACDADDELDEDEEQHPSGTSSVDSILQAAKNYLIIYDHTLKKLERALKAYKHNMIGKTNKTKLDLRA